MTEVSTRYQSVFDGQMFLEMVSLKERRADLSSLPRKFGSHTNVVMHEAAEEFLTRYYDLAVRAPVAECKNVSGFVVFRPELVFRFFDPAVPAEILALLMPGAIYPLGTTGGHTVHIFMNAGGKCYLLHRELDLFGELGASADQALQCLFDGRNARVDSQILDAAGRPTGHIICSSNQTEFWNLQEYQEIVRFFPKQSLAPLMRPPTWEPMVKSVQEIVQRDGVPTDWANIMVLPGGITFDYSGTSYYISHSENSLYIKESMGVTVLPPPTGVPRDLRAGECVPWKPPGAASGQPPSPSAPVTVNGVLAELFSAHGQKTILDGETLTFPQPPRTADSGRVCHWQRTICSAQHQDWWLRWEA